MAEKIVMAECSTCGGTRACTILFGEEKPWHEEDEERGLLGLNGWDRHEVLQCRGCQKKFFRHLSRFSEDCDAEGNNPTRVVYYPAIEKRRMVQRFDSYFIFFFDSKIDGLRQEIYKAINNDIPCLAAMGIRSLIEVIAITLTKVQDERFTERIARLVSDGWISSKQQEILDAALELGHGVIHRGHIPKMEDVQVALDIVDNIIDLMIINKEKAKKLKDSVPPRPQKIKKPKVSPAKK